MAPASRGGAAPKFKYREREPDSVKKRSEQDGGGFDSIFKSGIDTWRAKVGDNLIRFVPPTWEDPDHYGYDVWVHSYVGADNGSYLCPKKMLNKRCPICEAQKEAADAGETEEAKQLKAKKQVAAWIIDRDADNATPQVFLMSWTMDRDIAALCHNKRTGKVLMIDNPDNGYDFTLKRSGAGLKTRYFGHTIDRDPSAMMDSQKETNKVMEYVTENPIPDILLYKDVAYLESVVDGTNAKKDADEEDEKPSKRRARDESDDDDDKPVKRKRAEPEDEEEEKPSRRRRADPEDDADAEDEKPVKRRRAEPEEDAEDEKPSKRRRASDDPDDDEAEKPAKRRRAEPEEDADEDEKPVKRRRSDPEPDEEEEEEKPSKRRRAEPEEDADEDEKPVKRKRAEPEEDEDEKPAKRRRAEPEEDEDEKPVKRRRAEPEEDAEDEKPVKRRRAEPEEDEDEKPAKRRRAEPEEVDEEEEERPTRRRRA